MKPLNDISESVSLNISESVISGVLGMLSGPFFFLNKPSRNKRIYPEEAWVNALKDKTTQRFLENGIMLGTVGHKDMDFDDLVSEQKVSHITKSLKIIEQEGQKVGWGEAAILDTPVGRILYTICKAGGKIAVSSKAAGEYKGKDEDGNSIVDPNKFKLERFDFVFDPGYLEALPTLKEQFKEAYSIVEEKDKNGNKEAIIMEKLLEKLTSEKISLELQVKELLGSVAQLQEELKQFREIGSLRDLKETKKVAKSYTSVISLSEMKDKLEELDKFKKLGTYLSVKEELQTLKKRLSKYSKIGSVKDILTANSKVETLLKELKPYGNLNKIRETFNKVSSYDKSMKKYGSFKDIKRTFAEANRMLDEMGKFGSLAAIKETFANTEKLVAALKPLGTIPQIKESLLRSKKLLKSLNKKQVAEEVEALSAKFGVSKKKLESMLKKMSKADVISLLEDLSTVNKDTAPYRKESFSKDKTNEKFGSKVRTTRLYEGFSSPK